MSSVLELHPDELLDKDARGELTSDEETRLLAHLAHCSACRLEREVARDFRMELAAGDSDLELESLVTRALAGAKTTTDDAPDGGNVEPDRESSPAPRHISSRRRRLSPVFVAAACAVFSVVGIAAAAEWTGVWHGKSEGAGGSSNVTNKATSLGPSGSAPLPSPPSSIVGVATQEEPALAVPSAEPATTAAPMPSAAMAVPMVHSVALVAPAPPAPTVTAEPVAAPSAPPAPPVTPDAATLFAEANRAKARGQHAEAVRNYRELSRTYPGSPEAKLANAIVGRLLLDDGNAVEAIASLDRYLASGDRSLREEALAARAMALGRLGRQEEEAATWRQLLQSYPQSMHAKRAEARLAEPSPR